MTKCTCLWYWFIFLPYVCPFFKILCWTINWWFCKQNITWLRQSMRKWKAETVLSDTVGYYHRSKLCCLGIYKLSCFQSEHTFWEVREHRFCLKYLFILTNTSFDTPFIGCWRKRFVHCSPVFTGCTLYCTRKTKDYQQFITKI